MATGKPRIYWDTSVFLSWINGESRPQESLLGMEKWVGEASVGNVILVTSVITETEIYEAALTEAKMLKVQQVLRNPNVCFRANVDPRIAREAGNLREFCKNLDGRRLSTPDSIHIATAIVWKCAEMHTFDDKLTKLTGLGNINIPITTPKDSAPLLALMGVSSEDESNTRDEEAE